MPKIFLDKIVTSAHLPPQRGSTGYTSTTTLPDLSHTLVHTEYAPAIIQAMTPKGEMTRKFRAYGHKLAREVERPRSEMKRKAKFFKRAHNVFANKILLDMQKNTRRSRRPARKARTNTNTMALRMERTSSWARLRASVRGSAAL